MGSTRIGSEVKLKCTKYFRDDLTLVVEEQVHVSYKKLPSSNSSLLFPSMIIDGFDETTDPTSAKGTTKHF